MREESDKALLGKRVVVTRAAEQSERLVEALKERGATPVVVPMVAFGPADHPELLDEAIRKGRSYDWMFLTSQNALRALRERSALLKLDVRVAFAGVKIAAVGPVTAEAATQAGLQVAHVAAKRQGIGLAEELSEQVRGKRVFLARSDRANPALVKALNGVGAEVTEVCAYKTVKPGAEEVIHAAGMIETAPDAVLFFSPSAVHHFEESLGSTRFLEWSRRGVFAAIGPVTKEALHQAGVSRVLLAKDPSVSGVVETLAGHFAKEGAGWSAGVKPA